MGGDEENRQESQRQNNGSFITGIILEFYDELVELDCLYSDLYNMTIKELEKTLLNKRKGLAYKIWRLASLTRSPFTKNFPDSPQKAMPELYPKKQGIKMPSFLIEKAIKRGVL